jgi:hypothetical protein
VLDREEADAGPDLGPGIRGQLAVLNHQPVEREAGRRAPLLL